MGLVVPSSRWLNRKCVLLFGKIIGVAADFQMLALLDAGRGPTLCRSQQIKHVNTFYWDYTNTF